MLFSKKNDILLRVAHKFYSQFSVCCILLFPSGYCMYIISKTFTTYVSIVYYTLCAFEQTSMEVDPFNERLNLYLIC